MSRRTLAGLSKKLLEEEEHDQEEKEQEEKEEQGQEETAEQKENPHPDPEDQDEDNTDLVEYLKRRKKRKKQEETHTRKTFLIENDMLSWMKRQAKKYGFGFYTDFVNMSLKLGREQLEAAEREKKK